MSADISTDYLVRSAPSVRDVSPAQHTAARVIGILYPIQMATGIFGEVFARGQLIVRGDPTRTAENIMASEQLFRFSIA